MANGDYGYFGKGDTGYAQYMTAFNRNFGGSSGGGGGGNHNNGGGGGGDGSGCGCLIAIYEVAVDLPGCKKEDVQMDLNDGYLTIQAVRSHSNDEKDKKGRYLRRESFSGTCARSFYVGDVKKEDIHAKFEDGVLYVELPAPQQTKALPENPNLIEIE